MVRFLQTCCLWLIATGCLFLSAEEQAAPVSVLKVLPYRLDNNGLHAVSPSLFERDAYQAYLKDHPDEVSTMRFDVHLRLREIDGKDVEVRVEARFGKGDSIETIKATVPLKKPRWGKRTWTSVTLDKKVYDPEAQMIAWRVTLLRGEEVLDTQTSFLW